MSLLINNKQINSIHFTGILGSGMSAIAQYLRWQGINVSGSDRLLNCEDTAAVKCGLLSIGCQLFEQDGSGIQKTPMPSVSRLPSKIPIRISLKLKKKISPFYTDQTCWPQSSPPEKPSLSQEPVESQL